jgi:putative addiction module antidote
MTDKTRVRRFGGSLGVLIPKSIADSMALQEGDELFVISTPEGITVTPYDPDFADTMADARAFMRSHRNAFRELSK